jgi:hypothetical protein
VNLLRRLKLRRAAKRYARQLGSQLQRGYGAAEFYTPAQIRASVARLGLNPQFIALGYASFLNEEEFAALAAAMPMCIPYDEARELVARFQSTTRFGAADHYESGIGMTGGLDGGSP